MAYIDINWDKYLNNPAMIFDVGSYDGHDAISFKKKYPNAVVIAFEAGSCNYSCNKDHCEASGIVIHHKIVCDKVGMVKFNPTAENHAASGSIFSPTPTLHQRYPFIKFKDPEDVEAITISNFCEVNHICNIDLLHMDVQGAEDTVISGFGSIRPKLVFAEICAFEEYASGITKETFLNHMGMLGYSIAESQQYDILFKYQGAGLINLFQK